MVSSQGCCPLRTEAAREESRWCILCIYNITTELIPRQTFKLTVLGAPMWEKADTSIEKKKKPEILIGKMKYKNTNIITAGGLNFG